MNVRNEENLKEFFEQFGDAEQAEQIEQDICKGEQILGEYPAPEPDKELMADIKVEIVKILLRRKGDAFKRTAYKITAVAAAVIILAAIGIKLFEKGGGDSERLVTTSIIPEAIWESDDIATDDAELAILTAEIEQIDSEILAVQFGEMNGNGHKDLMELEMELIEINGNFWKG